MADYYSLCIIGLMDRLWFHQIVLFSESVAPKPVKTSMLPPVDEEEYPLTNEPLSPETQVSSSESTSLTSQEEGHGLLSLSSSAPNHHIKFRKKVTARRLQKSMSYRTQGELELEEVKGFMDLGFIFKKENVSARIMNVVPGLQRLNVHHNNKDEEQIDASNAVEKESGGDKSITRPYLSEAWLVKRPDSELLNLKIPRPCSTEDMKKHLRFWAKTVAFEIHQE